MFQTGQEVPASGIYRVEHREHRLAHEVVLVAGQRFPRCGRCAAAVVFELIKAAPLMSARNVIVERMSAREHDDSQVA